MIVETMTLDRICKEFIEDYEALLPKCNNFFGKLKDYDRYILKNLKSDQPHTFKPICVKSKNGNTFVVQYKVQGKANYKRDHSLYSNIYMLYDLNDGKYAVCKNKDDDSLAFFRPHFFKRFRERELKNNDLTPIEVIYDFFPRLSWVSHKKIELSKHPDCVFCNTGFGIMLGIELPNGSLLWKTYISYEMIFKSQIDDTELLGTLAEIDNTLWNPTAEQYLAQKRRINKPLEIKEWIKLPNVNDKEFIFIPHVGQTDIKEQLTLHDYENNIANNINDYEQSILHIFSEYKDARILSGNRFEYKIFNPIIKIIGKLHMCMFFRIKEENHVSDVKFSYFFNDKGELTIIHTPQNNKAFLVFSGKFFKSYGECYQQLKNRSIEQLVVNFMSRYEYMNVGQEIENNVYIADWGFGKSHCCALDTRTLYFEDFSL